MKVITLLKPRFWSFKNVGFLKKVNAGFFLIAGIGLIFWGGIFAVSYRILIYFQQVEDIGDILAYKLLSMALLTFFSLLIFSSILTSLSKLYLSKDLALVHSMPVCREKIFLARWIESSLDSSWMVIVYAVPVFVAYGIVYMMQGFFSMQIWFLFFLCCVL